MVFLCFSVKDRIPLVNDFHHFLRNFGIDTWYDRRNIFWGDNRQISNIDYGVRNPEVKYSVVFYSDNFAKGNICKEEYRILVTRYKRKDVHLFPVFLGETPQDIDPAFSLCKELVYKNLYTHEDFRGIALHILAKITSDEVKQCAYTSINEILSNYSDIKSLPYQMLIEYDHIHKEDYTARIIALFFIYTALTFSKPKNCMHFKTVKYIYHHSCLHPVRNEARELQIMENIIVCSF